MRQGLRSRERVQLFQEEGLVRRDREWGQGHQRLLFRKEKGNSVLLMAFTALNSVHMSLMKVTVCEFGNFYSIFSDQEAEKEGENKRVPKEHFYFYFGTGD